MFVKYRMTPHPITVAPDTSVAEALGFMRQNRVRRLPVVDKKGTIVGIVTEKDLLYASPSPATSLSVYEIGYLLSRLKVEEIMKRDVITVGADAPLEEAARIMADNKIGSLPVVEGDKLVGIITETDIFKAFLEMMGAREQGIRVTMRVKDEPGTLSRITGAVAGLNGDIVALGALYGEDRTSSFLTIKVRWVEEAALKQALTEAGAQIMDVRQI